MKRFRFDLMISSAVAAVFVSEMGKVGSLVWSTWTDTPLALNKYLDEERQNLFPDVDEIFIVFKGKARGRPLSVNALQHAIEYYAEKCQLSLHAHLFRHTGITRLVMQGMSEPAIRKLVRHRNAHSLDPYLHLSDRFVEAEFEKAQEILSPQKWLHSWQEGEQR